MASSVKSSNSSNFKKKGFNGCAPPYSVLFIVSTELSAAKAQEKVSTTPMILRYFTTCGRVSCRVRVILAQPFLGGNNSCYL